MSPEERNLLAGLFERIKSQANAPRDQEAENFINDQVKALPAAPYLLSQTVIVQDMALQSANQKLQQLEARVRELESQPKSSGGFLGGLFGGAAASPPPPPPRPAPNYGQPQGGPWGAPQGGYAPQPGYAPQQPGFGQGGFAAPAAGGGFLKGALGTAAGVAGGVLLADSIRGLFHGGGMGGGLGIDSGFQHTGGETVINNYYGDDVQGGGPGTDAGYGPDDDAGAQDADYPDDGGYDDGGFDSGGDGGFDV